MLAFYTALIETEEQRGRFEYIYETYYGLMYHTAVRLTKDQQLAEDAVHEVCLQLIHTIEDVRTDDPRRLAAYLRILTRSRTIDLLRRWQRGKKDVQEDAEADPPAGTGSEPEEVLLNRLNLERALAQLAEMPEKYRGPLTLQVKGYSIREIGQALDLPEGTVKTRIFRARQMLLQGLEA